MAKLDEWQKHASQAAEAETHLQVASEHIQQLEDALAHAEEQGEAAKTSRRDASEVSSNFDAHCLMPQMHPYFIAAQKDEKSCRDNMTSLKVGCDAILCAELVPNAPQLSPCFDLHYDWLLFLHPQMHRQRYSVVSSQMLQWQWQGGCATRLLCCPLNASFHDAPGACSGQCAVEGPGGCCSSGQCQS